MLKKNIILFIIIIMSRAHLIVYEMDYYGTDIIGHSMIPMAVKMYPVLEDVHNRVLEALQPPVLIWSWVSQ